MHQIEGMFDKLGKVAGQLKEKKKKLPYSPILFERTPYSKGMEHFDILYKAILSQKPSDSLAWFSPVQGNYIKTQHLHDSQQILYDTSHGLTVSLQLIPNYELLQVLLAFGPEVKVLEAARLREML